MKALTAKTESFTQRPLKYIQLYRPDTVHSVDSILSGSAEISKICVISVLFPLNSFPLLHRNKIQFAPFAVNLNQFNLKLIT